MNINNIDNLEDLKKFIYNNEKEFQEYLLNSVIETMIKCDRIMGDLTGFNDENINFGTLKIEIKNKGEE